MRTVRRISITLASVVAGSLTVAACGSSSGAGASASGTAGGSSPVTITVEGYTAQFQTNFTKAVIDPFMKKYPNIKVKYTPVQNSAQNLANLQSSKSNPNVNVDIMDVSTATTANKTKLFAPLDPSIVTNLKDIAKQGRTPGNYGPAVTFDSLSLIYNSSKVKPAPTTWKDLFNPKYKGQIAIPAAPDIQGLAFMVILDHLQGANYKTSIDPAVKQLKKLAPSVQTWSDQQPNQYQLTITGQVSMAIAWNARSQFYKNQSKGKLQVVIPKAGTVFQKNMINLVNNAPNKEASEKFINYALSPKAQAAFTDAMFYAPTNTKAIPLASKAAIARTALGPSTSKSVLPVDWNYIAQKSSDWSNIWKTQIIG